jgi:hypothetical protein
MNITRTSGSMPSNAVQAPTPLRTAEAQPPKPNPPEPSLPGGQEMQNSIIKGALSNMEKHHARFEDKSPMPRPSPTAEMIQQMMQQYQKAQAASEQGSGISVMA